MSIRSVPLIQISGTELLGSWLARLRIKKLIEESLSAGASAPVQPQVGGVVYNTPFLDLLRLNSNIIGTLVMLRGMLECVTWHLLIGEVPATVWIGNACGGLHLWISQIVIV